MSWRGHSDLSPTQPTKGMTMDIVYALITLLVHGDYTPALRPLLGEEDSPLVAFILTITGH